MDCWQSSRQGLILGIRLVLTRTRIGFDVKLCTIIIIPTNSNIFIFIYKTHDFLQSRYPAILCEKHLCYSGFISILNTGLWHWSIWGRMPLMTPIPYPLYRDHTFTLILPHPVQTSNSVKYFIHSNESLQSFHMQEFDKTSFVIEQLWDAPLTFFHHMRWSTSVLWNRSDTSFSVT